MLGGRFILEERVGAGGMGEVYRARDQETGVTVAVKLLLGQSKRDVMRFAREARVLAALRHPGIVRHIAHGELASGEPYLVMEWLVGEDLAKALLRGRFGVKESVALCARVAEALGAAHAQQIVHRDVKPSNVFLACGRIDQARVIDFGLALSDATARLTRTGAFVGTPGYMAPEQVNGDAHLDARADVFSLGCVLYECLSGEAAFRGKHWIAIVTKILFHDPPPIRAIVPTVSEALSSLLSRMLAKDPAARPRDAAEVALALAALSEEGCSGTVRAHLAERERTALTEVERRPVAVILIWGVEDPSDADAEQDGQTQPRK